jgi:hypothetical protein
MSCRAARSELFQTKMEGPGLVHDPVPAADPVLATIRDRLVVDDVDPVPNLDPAPSPVLNPALSLALNPAPSPDPVRDPSPVPNLALSLDPVRVPSLPPTILPLEAGRGLAAALGPVLNPALPKPSIRGDQTMRVAMTGPTEVTIAIKLRSIEELNNYAGIATKIVNLCRTKYLDVIFWRIFRNFPILRFFHSSKLFSNVYASHFLNDNTRNSRSLFSVS